MEKGLSEVEKRAVYYVTILETRYKTLAHIVDNDADPRRRHMAVSMLASVQDQLVTAQAILRGDVVA